MRRAIFCMMLAFGATADIRANCLDEVSSFAKKICGKIQTSSSLSKELNADLNREISRMASKHLGNASTVTEVKRVTAAYENVLRIDLSKKQLKDAKQCRIKMIEVGRLKLCKTPAVSALPVKKYMQEPQNNFPGVAITYPGSWVEKEAGTGLPRILPPLDSAEDKAGLEIEIDVSSLSREGVEHYAGIRLPENEPRYPEKLTHREHLRFIKQFLFDVHQDISWKGERSVQVAVYSDTENPPDSKTTEKTWIVDYDAEGHHFRELHFFQQTSDYQGPAESFGLVTVTCSVPKGTFRSGETACNKLLESTVFISNNYFSD
jgi:hypothetical protein